MKNKKQMSIEQDKKIESSTSYLRFKQKFNKLFKISFLSLLLLFFSTEYNTSGTSDIESISSGKISQINYLRASREKIKSNLILEVETYMNSVSPGYELDPSRLVDYCLMYDMDISFVLAQGILESHLGTKGKAFFTKSVWNVGAYDDGTIKHSYSDANESIEPYLRLIKQKYLGDNREIKDLIKNNGFKTLKGHRYASAKNYEENLRYYIIHVNLNTSINMYQQLLKLSDDDFLQYFSLELQNL